MKGRQGYGPDIKVKAKALWIVGNHTDEQIANRLGIQRPETVGEWRRREGWIREKEEIQKLTDERIALAVAETISEMNARHLKEAQLLQSRGVQSLRTLEPTKAAEAASMIDTGIRLERLTRGEPTQITEVRALMRANVEILELVVADVIRVLIEADKMDKRLAKAFADEFAEKVNAAPFRYAVTE